MPLFGIDFGSILDYQLIYLQGLNTSHLLSNKFINFSSFLPDRVSMSSKIILLNHNNIVLRSEDDDLITSCKRE